MQGDVAKVSAVDPDRLCVAGVTLTENNFQFLNGGQGALKSFWEHLLKTVLGDAERFVPTPAVFRRLADVPLALFWVDDFIQNRAVVEPRNLSSNLLDKLGIGVSLCKGAHREEICPGKSPSLHRSRVAACLMHFFPSLAKHAV